MGKRQKVKLCGKGQDGNVGSQCAQGLPILEMAQRPKELNPSMTSDLLSRLQRSLGLCSYFIPVVFSLLILSNFFQSIIKFADCLCHLYSTIQYIQRNLYFGYFFLNSNITFRFSLCSILVC